MPKHCNCVATSGTVEQRHLPTCPLYDPNRRPPIEETPMPDNPTTEHRDQAVANVDARHGFTVEFAPDPEQHRAEYDNEEERLHAATPLPEPSGETYTREQLLSDEAKRAGGKALQPSFENWTVSGSGEATAELVLAAALDALDKGKGGDDG